MELLKAAILGLLEGLTEFIPVSSTGHLIVAAHILKFEGEMASTFEVFIQLGAILAVVFLYKERFFQLLRCEKGEGLSGINGLTLLMLTTFPALLLGAVAHGFIKEHLFNPATVAIGLLTGGIAILLMENILLRPKKSGVDFLTWKDALFIGLFQCIAMWPGVSRSAATILGAMSLGIDRKTSAEYSFLAAVPVMFAATSYDLYNNFQFIERTAILIFFIGFVVAFISALFSVKYFMSLIGNYTLKPFGWYRIAVAPVIYWFLG